MMPEAAVSSVKVVGEEVLVVGQHHRLGQVPCEGSVIHAAAVHSLTRLCCSGTEGRECGHFAAGVQQWLVVTVSRAA